MNRGKKIIVVAHCYLNQNARVKPYASRAGAFKELISPLIDADFGIIQLPCPETTACGLKRWEAVTEQYNTPNFRRHCRKILQPYIDQFYEHNKAGDKIYAVFGVPFSPCCGIRNNPSCKSWGGPIMDTKIQHLEIVDGPAVFMEELMKMCDEINLKINFIDVSEDKNSFPHLQPEKILKELLKEI
jgi:predicted secreted protein